MDGDIKVNSINKRVIFYFAIAIAFIALIIISIFIIKRIQSQTRISKFNQELQEAISDDMGEKTVVSVEEPFGGKITLTYESDNFLGLTSNSYSESEKIVNQQFTVSLYRLSCLNSFMKRSDLLDLYSSDIKYLRDKSFFTALKSNPICYIKEPNTTFEIFQNDSGDFDVMINGELYEYVNLDDVYSYGNPSPALQEMMTEYKATINAKEVQYDMSNNVGKYFGLEGKAELCDYYNYGYDDSIEPDYFCMEVTPNGSSYNDSWYIYADRESFGKTYSGLLNNEISVLIIAYIDKYRFEKNQQNQATLFAIKW